MAPQPTYSHVRAEHRAAGLAVRLIGCQVLNEQTTPVLGEQLSSLIEESPGINLLLDLGSVKYLTSTTLGMLHALQKRLRTSGGQLILYGVSKEILEIFVAARLDDVFDLRQEDLPDLQGERQSGPGETTG